MENKANSNNVKVSFNKEIGVFGGVSIIGGIMVGSGIFYLGSLVLQRTHMSFGMALFCWIIGGIVSLLGGLCFAELGASYTKAGGMVVYLNEAYHPIVGFCYGFSTWLIGGAGSIAAVSIALPTALKGFIDLNDFQIKIVAILLIIGLTIYNCFGVKKASILQNISMAAKIIPLLAIIILALAFGKETPSLSLLPPDGTSVNFSSLIGTIAFATVATLWAYEGWVNLNFVSEEMKNPKRNLPLAIIIGIGGITLLYTIFNFAIYKVIPQNEVISMIDSGELYLGTEVVKRIVGNGGVIIVVATMVIAMFGSLNGMILAQSRIYYAMADEGHFFKSFARLHPKYHVPNSSLIWQAVISICLVLLRNLSQLTAMVVFLGMLFNTLVICAVIIFRKKHPQLERPYKILGYPFTVIITTFIFTALMINTFIEDPITALVGFIVPIIGIGVYMIFDWKLKNEKMKQEVDTN